MIEKFASAILVGEASTSRGKSKFFGCKERKSDDTSSTVAKTLSAHVTPLGRDKEKRRGFVSQGFRMMVASLAERMATGIGSVLSSYRMK
ncbi:UNVERIFIED_CONTAM: hypothetical protein Sradi_2657900, partial [Sesamum radiatum]